MYCEICKEEDVKTSLERYRGRIRKICDWCMGAIEDNYDREREERKIEDRDPTK